MTLQLNTLAANPGKNRTRVGRGIGSGKGKTAGRGHKGAKSRSGVSLAGFEGGQTPLFRRVSKFGFRNFTRKKLALLTTGQLQAAVDAKRLPLSISLPELRQAKLIKGRYDGWRIVHHGTVKSKLKVEVTGISAAAKADIEAAGGQVSLADR